MNSTNKYENKSVGLIAKLVCSMGNMFASVATAEPRGCWNGLIYELEFPQEVAEEIFLK